jgi:hypothetical protein
MPNLYRSQLNSVRTVLLASLSCITSIYGHPLTLTAAEEAEPEIDFGSAEFYEKIIVIFALVLIGGVFAGTLILLKKGLFMY